MYAVQFGGKRGKRVNLMVSKDLVAVRTHSRQTVNATSLSRDARTLVGQFESVLTFPAAGVEVLRPTATRPSRGLRDRTRTLLKRERDVRFAGRVLCDPKSGAPVLYTENFFVKFEDDRSATSCKKILKQYQLSVKRELEYARNAYFVEAQEGTGLQIFESAAQLLAQEHVEFCHPELVRQVGRRTAFAQQWHLKTTTINGTQINAHSHVEDAWALSQGEGTVIAVIDDGVDLDHEEFMSSNKIVAPRDATFKTNNPRPGSGDNHGTACAGVACADGVHGASGVAPKAQLMPIRLVSDLGSQEEADSIFWAAQHGADVISCSWGPYDGEWWNPADPLHHQVAPLPDSTRLAIDWAIQNGRNGKGCVMTWAAGNGNESVDSSFPSNDGNPSKTLGIWTTDRSGAPGYNPGQSSKGDVPGHYTNSFGGTSSACPGAAGVAALVIARNPSLRWDEVKDILKRSCDQIDRNGGQYDSSGHSPFYGFGRLNALTAVNLAVPSQPAYKAVHTAVQDVAIEDLKTSKITVAVGDTKKIKGITVAVDIEHTYIGDLIVMLVAPTQMGVAPITLHDGAGGGTHNLKTSFDVISVPNLSTVVGKNPEGTWTLQVEDKAKQDTGKIISFSVQLSF